MQKFIFSFPSLDLDVVIWDPASSTQLSSEEASSPVSEELSPRAASEEPSPDPLVTNGRVESHGLGYTTVTLVCEHLLRNTLLTCLETVCARLYEIGLAVTYVLDDEGELTSMSREQKRFGRASKSSMTADSSAHPSAWELEHRKSKASNVRKLHAFSELSAHSPNDGGSIAFRLTMKGN